MSAWRLAPLLAAAPWYYWPAAGANVVSMGASECPCITEVTEAVKTQISDRSGSDTYGLQGCKAYNENNGDICMGGPYCQSQWCFVNMSVCPINKDKCNAVKDESTGQNLRLGSLKSPFCRDRQTAKYRLGDGSKLDYSYHTCGNLKTTLQSEIMVPVQNVEIQMRVREFRPYVVKRSADEPSITERNKFGYEGAIFEFFIGLAASFDPPPVFNLSTSWASKQALEGAENNSETACCNEILIGSADACVTFMWVTEKRLQYTSFLPSFMQDHFFLVTKSAREFESYFWLAFWPYTITGWLTILGGIIYMSVLLFGVDYYDAQRKKELAEQGLKDEGSLFHSDTPATDLPQNLYMGLRDTFAGSSDFATDTIPRKIIVFGFSLFLLVALSGYTASLTTFLLSDAPIKGVVSSWERATKQEGFRLCVTESLVDIIEELGMPRGHIVSKKSQYDCSTWLNSTEGSDELHRGAIFSDTVMQALEAGWNPPKYLFNTTPICNFVKVGKSLFSVPVSVPVSAKYRKSLAWATLGDLFANKFDDKVLINERYMPHPLCHDSATASSAGQEGGLPLAKLLGTIIIATLIASSGLVILAWRHFRHIGKEPDDGWATAADTTKKKVSESTVL